MTICAVRIKINYIIMIQRQVVRVKDTVTGITVTATVCSAVGCIMLTCS